MFKNLSVAALALVFAITLGNCGKKDEPKANPPTTQTAVKDKDKDKDKTKEKEKAKEEDVDSVVTPGLTRKLFANATTGGAFRTQLLSEMTREQFEKFEKNNCIQVVQYKWKDRAGQIYKFEWQKAACPAKGIQKDESVIVFKTLDKANAPGYDIVADHHNPSNVFSRRDILGHYSWTGRSGSTTSIAEITSFCAVGSPCELEFDAEKHIVAIKKR